MSDDTHTSTNLVTPPGDTGTRSEPGPEPKPEIDVKRPPFNEVSVLFPILTFYTVGYLGLLVAQFLTRGVVTAPEGMMPIYVALLGAYAADKEVRRWMGTPEPPRKGSLFVYAWLVFFLLAYVLCAFYSKFVIPADVPKVVLQTLGVFFGSRASKYIHERRVPGTESDVDPTTMTARQTQVMAIIQTQGRVTRRQVMDALGLSESSAKRLLVEMIGLGIIRAEGEGRGLYYVAVQKVAENSGQQVHDPQ